MDRNEALKMKVEYREGLAEKDRPCDGCEQAIKKGLLAREIITIYSHGRTSEFYHLPYCPKDEGIFATTENSFRSGGDPIVLTKKKLASAAS